MKKYSLLPLLALIVIGSVRAQTLGSYNFASSNQGWSNNGDWAWSSSSGSWEAPFHSVRTITTLLSPVITVTANGTISGSVTHAYDFETNYDGGRFEFTTNGGVTWNVIALNLFTARGYTGLLELNDFGQQVDGAAFTGFSGLVTSTFAFGTGGEAQRYQSGGMQSTFGAGTQLQFRFLSSWGDDDGPPSPNWRITSASFQLTAVAIPEPSHYATLGGLAALAFLMTRRITRSRVMKPTA